MSYVVVKFPERREVFIDNRSEGDNVSTGTVDCAPFS